MQYSKNLGWFRCHPIILCTLDHCDDCLISKCAPNLLTFLETLLLWSVLWTHHKGIATVIFNIYQSWEASALHGHPEPRNVHFDYCCQHWSTRHQHSTCSYSLKWSPSSLGPMVLLYSNSSNWMKGPNVCLQGIMSACPGLFHHTNAKVHMLLVHWYECYCHKMNEEF